jgi:signal transduction histidine kinase
MRLGGSYPRDIAAIAAIFIVLILFVAGFNLYVSFQFKNEFVEYGRNNVIAVINVSRGYMKGVHDPREINSLLRNLSQSFNLEHLVIADTLGNRIYDSWAHLGGLVSPVEFDLSGIFQRMPDAQELIQKDNAFIFRSTDPPAYFYVALLPAYTAVFGNIFRWHIFYITISLVFMSFLGLFLLRNLFLPMRYVTNLARDFGIEMKKEDFVSATFDEVYRKLKLREQMLVEFSAYMAHEFRNSLGAIIGLARLVEKGRRPGSEIVKECRNMEELITRILEYSKPLTPNVAETDLNRILADALDRTAIPKRIRVAKDLAAETLLIKGDHELLTVAVCNLLKNAREAIRGKGQIELMTGRREKVVFLTVKDDGVGIDAGEQSSIFNPFFSRKADGMGLGLAYVRKVAEEHGIRISVRSKKGKGAAFTLEFPA